MPTRALLTRRPGDERGAAAVEFALVMPILLLLVFGIIQYGLYFWSYQGGSDAGRSAARLAAVGEPIDCSDFAAAIGADVAPLGSGSAVVRRTYQDGAGNPVPAADVEIGDYVVVYVEFDSVDLNFPLPFVNNGTVASESRARVEYLNNGDPIECDELVSV